jgi:hypothetical protein
MEDILNQLNATYINNLSFVINNIYRNRNINQDTFQTENNYLLNAFIGMENFWYLNMENITNINMIVICESPLWGNNNQYFYNPQTAHSQFMYYNDINFLFNNQQITNKLELIQRCNELGIIIIDVSPFALNEINTSINYNQLTTNEYNILIEQSINHYFIPKLNYIINKPNIHIDNNIKVVYRYNRVKQKVGNIVNSSLINLLGLDNEYDFECIGQNGGGINRQLLLNLLQ